MVAARHLLYVQGPCAGNTPHTHPRGSEISFLLYGNITFGMIEVGYEVPTLHAVAIRLLGNLVL